ncbi:acetoin dehydrogenase dihydrolipoyllysine-residue acetyltransferase subunit [Rhizobium hidalgonense]|uniref:acetoin dehydrogenase dihydrolipoyllysine-residue acetyltransferase subunit n=1 Tax=Rhizobium hidalgonense TaxID=1538159 RepID=UPI0011069003|nr:acetoin dehydrogenase dihydrolipoyllysine-residue acetyltransferase subunit [Rhizobium hidalgonense]QKK27807.1 acetoin dehydrogenase dihydrolipoyllysine-residue acetyltransferase subunit [Rhizobium hidalgonense]
MTERILKMPRLGETMDEGKVVGWLIQPGDVFKRGDPIVEIETDKTIAEYPALGDGTLHDIIALVGVTVEVGQPLARIDIGIGPDWTADEPAAPARTTGLVETDLDMPRLGETMEEGRVAKWLKAPGDSFARGEAIIEIETDKTIAEFPALMDGTLVSILRGDGEMVTVGEPIGRISIAASDAREAKPAEIEASVAAVPVPAQANIRQRATGGPVRATPVARRLCRINGVDLQSLAGTGRRARVEKADVLAALSGSPQTSGKSPDGVLFADLPRGRMAYLDTGKSGPRTALLLHGFAGDRTTWAAIASGLKRAGHRVLIPDLPSHGLTEIAASTAVDLSADLAAFLQRVALAGSIDIVAHSLGCVAAVDFAVTAPDRVGSLTLLAPAGLGPEIDGDFVHGMARATVAAEVSHLLRRLSVNPVPLSDGALAVLAGDLAKGRLATLAAAIAGPSGQKVDSLAKLEKLAASVETRVIFGLEDRIIPWRHVTSVSPRVAIHLLSRSGHMPQWDQPKDVLDILLSERA